MTAKTREGREKVAGGAGGGRRRRVGRSRGTARRAPRESLLCALALERGDQLALAKAAAMPRMLDVVRGDEVCIAGNGAPLFPAHGLGLLLARLAPLAADRRTPLASPAERGHGARVSSHVHLLGRGRKAGAPGPAAGENRRTIPERSEERRVGKESQRRR